jgi:hypothetical protein
VLCLLLYTNLLLSNSYLLKTKARAFPRPHSPKMAVIWGLDISEMKWSAFSNSYMWKNTDYHMRRTRFIIYQCAMILCVVSESLGTAALSGTFSPNHPTPPVPSSYTNTFVQTTSTNRNSWNTSSRRRMCITTTTLASHRLTSSLASSSLRFSVLRSFSICFGRSDTSPRPSSWRGAYAP